MAGQERDPMINVFVQETTSLIEQLETIIIEGEKTDNMDACINDIFRIMHTIKGNSMMMKFDKIAGLAHVTEDLFDYLRSKHPQNVNYTEITSVILDSIDFMKDEIDYIQNDEESSADNSELKAALVGFLESLKFMEGGASTAAPAPEKKAEAAVAVEKPPKKAAGKKKEAKAKEPPKKEAPQAPAQVEDKDSDGANYFAVTVFFEEECQMENMRAFSIVHNLDEFGCEIYHYPKDLEDDKEGVVTICNEGFKLALNCKQNEQELRFFFDRVSFMKEFVLTKIKREKFEEYAKEYQLYKTVFADEEQVSDELAQEPDVQAAEEVNEAQDVQDKQAAPATVAETSSAGATSVTPAEKPAGQETPAAEAPKPAPSVAKTADNASQPAERPHPETAVVKQQKFINVSVEKLDALMNLVGELVISESMVTQNPQLKELRIDSMEKAAGQLRKNINEIQDIVMEIRMVPLSTTFQRMNRIVRDMSVKINKSVELVLIGQETEVDKNIIEHISDPLMHLIRNAIDHGLESPDERERKGKPRKGTVTLEAKNAGGDVWIIVRDDGRGLDREKILAKAAERGSLKKPAEEYTDREAYNFIFEAGLSTKEEVTGFSGRGVGMDAVNADLEKIGGTVVIESEKDKGSSINLKIPLTLAIVNGMVMSVGQSKFTLPITAIQEAFKARMQDIIVDPDGNEMILVRGDCYSIIRLHELFGIETEITDFAEGIFVMLKDEDHKICLFVDYLIGEHQVVVKSFSKYINKIKGISGCAHLGDGGICLILDASGLTA